MNEKFLQNKYLTWYKQLIANALVRITDPKMYYEKHHIIPKCMGGSNNKDNLVNLTAKEHLIAHRFLVKMTIGKYKRKMSFALWRMVHGNKSQDRYKISSRQYSYFKLLMSRASSEQNRIRGNSYVTDELRKKFKGRIPWNKGLKGQCFTDAQKAHLSNINKGKIHSESTRQKLSKSCTGKLRPRFRWILYNSITFETEETTNLSTWSKSKGFHHNKIRYNNSDWKIVEKYRLKDNVRIK